MPDIIRTQKVLTYDDVMAVPAGGSKEPLVDARKYDSTILTAYDKLDMIPFTGEIILLRDSLAQKLAIVSQQLRARDLRLKVVYGYRHPAVQVQYFQKRRQELKLENPEIDPEELDRYTHAFVAVPDVGGHPAGGAVDLTIIDNNNNDMDMGTLIADYSDPDKIQTYTSGLTAEQTQNRALLHDLMVAQDFAPFYGEWWHFSYGDREWAAFYGIEKALYGPIELQK